MLPNTSLKMIKHNIFSSNAQLLIQFDLSIGPLNATSSLVKNEMFFFLKNSLLWQEKAGIASQHLLLASERIRLLGYQANEPPGCLDQAW